MSANAFFKSAASHIRQGIAAKNQEIGDKRREIELKKSETDQYVQKIKLEMRLLEVTLTSTNNPEENPDASRPQKLRRVTDLHQDIANKQAEFTQWRERALGEIKQMEGDLIGLEQQAKDLEVKA